jgi:hypothetical protein
MGVYESEIIKWFIEGQAFSTSHDMAPLPPPSHPLPSESSTGDTQKDRQRNRENLLTGEGRGGGRAKSYDGEKARSSITYSILSSISPLVIPSLFPYCEQNFLNKTTKQRSKILVLPSSKNFIFIAAVLNLSGFWNIENVLKKKSSYDLLVTHLLTVPFVYSPKLPMGEIFSLFTFVRRNTIP